jgi:hypothetical protein
MARTSPRALKFRGTLLLAVVSEGSPLSIELPGNDVRPVI